MYVLDNALRLLHPAMPFVTEAIWEKLPHGDEANALMAAAWPAQSAATLVSGCEVYCALSGLVDFEAERARLSKELDKLEKEAAKLDKKLSNPGYLAKAKPEIVEKDRAKHAEAAAKADLVRTQLSELG